MIVDKSTIANKRYKGMPAILYTDILSIITNFNISGTVTRIKMPGTPHS